MDVEKQQQSKEKLGDESNHNEMAYDSNEEAQVGGQGLSRDQTVTESGEVEPQVIEALKAELEKAKEESLEYKDRYLRTMAEAENFRKRHEKEKSDLLKYGSEKVMSDLLLVLDSFEKALTVDQAQQNEPFLEGMRMVQKQLLDVLGKYGLIPFDSEGELFDPNLHQAIKSVEQDVTSETVLEVYQKGYKLNDRLLRPAIVSVAVPSGDSSKES